MEDDDLDALVDDLEALLRWLMTWRFELELEIDLEAVLFYILLASWSLLHLRVGFLKPLLVGSERTQAGSCKKSWCSYFSWC